MVGERQGPGLRSREWRSLVAAHAAANIVVCDDHAAGPPQGFVPADVIAVVESAGSNLSSGRTDWWLEAEGEGTLLHYRMSLTPDFWVPPLIGPLVIRIALKRAGSRAVFRLEGLALERPRAAD